MNIILHMGDPYVKEAPNAKRMKAFYECFTSMGHQVRILAPRVSKEENERDVIYCGAIPMKKKTSLYRLLNQLSYAFTSFFAARKCGRADVVITTSPPPLISVTGWLIAKRKKARLVYDVRDIWPDVGIEMGTFAPGSLYAKVFASIRDFMLKKADLTTAVSPGKVKKLCAYGPTGEVRLVSNGFDRHFLENADDPALIEKFRFGEGFTCVYVGNLGMAQGLDQLLSVAERAKTAFPDARFLLFGSGAEEESLRAHVREKALTNVEFAGKIPNDSIFTILNHADLTFVSLVNGNLRDSVPTKLYEALGVGCPVLLAAEGDAAALLDESRLGIAVSPNDQEALWDAFSRLYHDLPAFKAQKAYSRELMTTVYSRQHASQIMEKELNKLF